MSAHDLQKTAGAVDSRHLLLLGTGPGLGASVARRFAREAYRLTLVARSQATTATLADELRGEGIDVTVVAADVGDPDRLRAAVAPLFGRPGAPGVVIYSAAGTPFDPDRIADAYWTIRNEEPDAWREEYRFDGALETTRPTAPATSRAD